MSKKLPLIASRYDVARRAVKERSHSSKLDVVFAI